jgi:hypothetical protein
MKRHHMAMAVSVLALAAAPSSALAGGGSLGGLVQQTQTATNSNETNQTANSTATSEQTNVNAPVSILSEDSNNGDVNQSNKGETSSSAQNNNSTEQGNSQNQKGSAGEKGSGDKGGSDGGKDNTVTTPATPKAGPMVLAGIRTAKARARRSSRARPLKTATLRIRQPKARPQISRKM